MLGRREIVQEPTIYIMIEEIGDYYIDRLMIIKTDRCTLEEAKKEAREAGYQVIDECCHVVHTAHEVHVIVAVEPEEIGGRRMQRIKRELTEAGIPYASEYLGGNIVGLRIGNMYIVEHGSGEGYYFGNLEDSEDVCYTLEEVLELAKKYKETEEIDVVVIEAGWDYMLPVEYFKVRVPKNKEQAVTDAIRAVKARGYRVIPNDAGGCNEYNHVSYGEDYITVTVEPE